MPADLCVDAGGHPATAAQAASNSHRLGKVAGLVVAAALLLGASACALPSQPPAGSEGRLLQMLNDYRASYGRKALQTVSDAQAKAESQAQAMASQHRLFHSSLTSGIGGAWYALGENIGEGGSIDSIESAFISSPDHRSNMLSTSYDQIGIGVARSSDGLYWVAEEFVGR